MLEHELQRQLQVVMMTSFKADGSSGAMSGMTEALCMIVEPEEAEASNDGTSTGSGNDDTSSGSSGSSGSNGSSNQNAAVQTGSAGILFLLAAPLAIALML